MKFDIEEIKKKNELVENAIIQLKKDFVGIDDQIDEVMNNVRTWYLYPQLQNRPIVVSIFGLTGTGKTSLIRRIAKYLNIEKDLVYFNFAEIGEMHSYEIESTIEDELSNEKSNRMFVYDEFQYAATLDEAGCEKDNKSCLKPFWELMDSGILHKRYTLWDMRVVINLLNMLLKINVAHPMKIENGQWVNSEECLRYFNEREISLFRQCLNFDYKIDKKEKTDRPSPISTINETDDENKDYFVKSDTVSSIVNLLIKSESKIDEKFKLHNKICEMNYNELIEFLTNSYEDLSKGYDLKFNDSIIFVIANLDEAYTVSFDVNPDMSPDQFHEITKKISIVDIKEALKKRFRNEQIARLGNIHVIYPSFSCETFKKIIDLSLDEYTNDVVDKLGINLKFDNSIKKCIYDESVYPTHGTRPVFSSIHEIIKSKLPEIVKRINEETTFEKVSYATFSFNKGITTVVVYDLNDNFLFDISFKEKLRLDNLRKSKKDEQQALCAVHESGHFVIYMALNGVFPEKVVSKTVESDTNGFLLEKFNENTLNSFETIFNELQVSLGGYIAERMVFDEDKVTSGAWLDLERCTVLASRAIREYGFGSHPYVTTYLRTINDVKRNGHIIRDEEQQDCIIKLIEKAKTCAEDILKHPEWHKMFVESCKYLSTHSSLPKNKMKELYNKVPDNIKHKNNDKYYRNKVANLL